MTYHIIKFKVCHFFSIELGSDQRSRENTCIRTDLLSKFNCTRYSTMNENHFKHLLQDKVLFDLKKGLTLFTICVCLMCFCLREATSLQSTSFSLK